MKYFVLFILAFSPNFFAQSCFWEQSDTIKNESIFSITINSKGNIFAGSWLGKIYFSTDKGETWNSRFCAGESNLIFCLAANSQDYIYAGTIGGGLFRSKDNGNTWIYSDFAGNPVISITVDSKNVLYAATCDSSHTIYKSSDLGHSWSAADAGLENTEVHALAVNSKDQIFAATFNGIYLSTDGGKSWVQKNNGLTNISVYSIGVNSDDCIFAGTFHDGEIFYSSDSGENWINKSNSLNKSFVRSFAFNGDNHVFTASHDGIFRSDDNGKSWININGGLSNKVIQVITADNNGVIYAGTWAGGAYKNLNPLLSLKEESNVPKTFKLEQNYPNPFNPSTKIKYSIPSAANVLLKVYDLLGKEIAVLVNEQKLPGNYEIVFSPQNAGGRDISLSSGVYFYSLQAGEFSSTKKFIFLK